jgi:uncharacterized membrane protein YjjP (DUF1212 family)
MNYKLLADTAVLTGEIMLLSGAETYRVEDTVGRILRLSGLETTKTIVTSTAIIVTLNGERTNPITIVGSVSDRDTNLNHIYLANNISRKLCNGKITLEEAYFSLSDIEDTKIYSDTIFYLCIIVMTTFFTVRIGGTFFECMVSAINGCIIVGFNILTRTIKLNKLLNLLLASFLIAIVSVVSIQFIKGSMDLERIIASSIMPLVPGVAITNAVRDTLQGNSVSGGARIIEAIVLASVIASGIGGGILICSTIFGGVGI